MIGTIHRNIMYLSLLFNEFYNISPSQKKASNSSQSLYSPSDLDLWISIMSFLTLHWHVNRWPFCIVSCKLLAQCFHRLFTYRYTTLIYLLVSCVYYVFYMFIINLVGTFIYMVLFRRFWVHTHTQTYTDNIYYFGKSEW